MTGWQRCQRCTQRLGANDIVLSRSGSPSPDDDVAASLSTTTRLNLIAMTFQMACSSDSSIPAFDVPSPVSPRSSRSSRCSELCPTGCLATPPIDAGSRALSESSEFRTPAPTSCPNQSTVRRQIPQAAARQQEQARQTSAITASCPCQRPPQLRLRALASPHDIIV